ncbi:class I SAM-dependent methyltransferase [Chitinophaga rhizophila]|uniref:Methyltransferase domain-containing protein n=1 Tax=Chitinophaga rhizophila TaxID=2866212 RepID=A0ABS7GM26_9BACT|nr:methyltransferase domain-containing protein [Chitinophaga rhizophila]MBW8687929.1 methyltransferase domain-containing protein [Chitinophaga rhizophila]
MAVIRKPFQGVYNIIRFNWHLYAISALLMVLCIMVASFLTGFSLLYLVAGLILTANIISLTVSVYVYDLSDLYKLYWIREQDDASLIVNIHAGFDETSLLLKHKYKNAVLRVIDFYDPAKHTEVSIQRARKAYPALPETIRSATTQLPLGNNVADKVFIIFSAHEIRNVPERTSFFHEVARIVRPGGEIYVTEHLRDLPNFLAYNIGFFHFYSRHSWLSLFGRAGLKVIKEIKITPFISTFILTKNDTAF